jgi:thiamine-phosphate pyrophosphorylase
VTDRHGFRGPFGAQVEQLLANIKQAVKAGVDWIQLREKDLSGTQLAVLASEAVRIAAGSSAILINDRLDVACAAGAAGVHLGEHSLPVGEAKRFVAERLSESNFLIGASVHSLGAALEAQKDGANYVIFGPVFATPSKAASGEPQGLENLRKVCAAVQIPVLAIGGVTLQNARECLEAGATGIAAIRLFQKASDLPAVEKRFRSGL